MVCRSGLFDQFNSTLGELWQVPQGSEAIPPCVDVDTDSGVAVQRLRDVDDARNVDCWIECSHLEFEAEIEPGFELFVSFLDDLVRRRSTQCPRDVDTLAESPAEERVHGDSQATRPGVVQRHVDGRLRESCIGNNFFDVGHDRGDVIHAPADHHRCDVLLDDDLHRLHRFATPPRPPGTTPSPYPITPSEVRIATSNNGCAVIDVVANLWGRTSGTSRMVVSMETIDRSVIKSLSSEQLWIRPDRARSRM